jgi:hypothetical protein
MSFDTRGGGPNSLQAWTSENSFDLLKKELLKVDPVSFAESYLTLDGKPFCITNNGWQFISQIYRYISSVAMSSNGKPIVIVKGRQVAATTMATNLELHMVSSGMFGTGGVPPVRVTHAFPHMYRHKKTVIEILRIVYIINNLRMVMCCGVSQLVTKEQEF